jgi:hypothetical protein
MRGAEIEALRAVAKMIDGAAEAEERDRIACGLYDALDIVNEAIAEAEKA